MALTVEQVTREFKYNGTALKDPDPKMSVEEVKEFYANLYPDINNAAIEGPTQTGAKMVYEFRRAVGTKGNDAAKDDLWAVVELFGHQRVAGKLTEQTLGGCHFIRIDVPDTPGTKAFTKLYTQGAIYGLTFVSEEIARTAAATYDVAPVSRYELRDGLRLLNAPRSSDGHSYD